MSVVVEPVVHLDALVSALGVVVGQLLQDVDLQLGGVSILFDVLDDFYGECFVLG